jgi:FkbM family methyltransferase
MDNMLPRLVKMFTRAYPFLSGHGSLLNAFPLNAIKIGDAEICTTLSTGQFVFVDASEWIGRAVFFFGDIDPKIRKTLTRIVNEGDTFIDIGANVGTETITASKMVGPRGRVVAVEPQRLCAAMLRKSVLENQLSNVEVFEQALSNRTGFCEMARQEKGNSGTAEIRDFADSSSATCTSPVVNTSDFLRGLEIVNDYVLKIDVEGHEGAILEGAKAYFEIHKPKAILFEANRHLYNSNERFSDNPAVQLLADANAKLFAIRKSLLGLKLIPVRHLSENPSATDYLARF